MMSKKIQKLMLFYQKISALDRARHSHLKLSPVSKFDFAAKTHWVPIACSEFVNAARFYPVIFVADSDGSGAITPIALLGLKLEQNDYIDKDGNWLYKAYIPAFIRRYPFLLAAQDSSSETLTICIDEAAPPFSENDNIEESSKIALFDDQGDNTAFLNQAIEFLQAFKVEMEVTQDFTKTLVEYDLLSSRNAQIKNAQGEVFEIADMLVIDEDKLKKLDDEKITVLMRSGVLGWIYAHLFSLANLNVLFDLHRNKNIQAFSSVVLEASLPH